jgi:hypothetical protein
LVNTAQSINLVTTDAYIKDRFPVKVQPNMHAFRIRDTIVELLNIQVADVSCGDNMCYALMMYKDGISVDRCACYSIAEGEARICLVLDLIVGYYGKDHGKNSFCVYNRTSKQCTWMCMQDFKIPIGVIPDTIMSDYGVVAALQQSVKGCPYTCH